MNQSPAAEIDRIREVYERRQQKSDRYYPLRRAVLMEKQHLERELARSIADEGWTDLSEARILDLGTGDGRMLLRLASLGARRENICGVDVMKQTLQNGRKAWSSIPLVCGDGRCLPFDDQTFDITLSCTLLSSVLDDECRGRIAGEMKRVTRAGGCIIWYDMRITRPDNPDVKPVGPKEARILFPDAQIKSRIVSLNPILARRVAPISWFLAEAMATMPFLCGHRLTTIRLPKSERRAG